MNTSTQQNTPAAAPADRLSIPLIASALVLAALLVVQIGRSGGKIPFVDSPAKADVVSRVGDYTALTFDGGNDDVMVVLDGRGEQLFVYNVKNQNSVQFLQRESLQSIFETGRRIGPGGQRK